MKNPHKMAVRVLNTTCRMNQASMRELLTFVEKNKIVREDDIKIFIRLSMCMWMPHIELQPRSTIDWERDPHL